MKKRALSLFLAVVFCFGLLPAGALEENDDTQTGGTTVLSADDAPDGEPCDHSGDDFTYTSNGDGTHKKTCNECGTELPANEDCFTESALSDIRPNGEAEHILKCICGSEKTEAHTPKTYPKAYPTADGKGHSRKMCDCGYTRSEDVESHTYDENGRCETCDFKPVFEDSKGNLYDFDGSYSTEALNEAIQNGITSFKLVNFAQGEGADTTTANAVFSLETDADVTLDMNGKTLTYVSGESTLTVSAGKLTVQGAATIQQTGLSQQYIKSAVKVTGGELVFENDLTAIGSAGRNAAAPAIEVSGGKVTFEKNVTATGGLQGGTGNTMTRQPAIHAMGGELDFQGDLDLNGGLTITGGAKLTRKLTQGKFYTNDSETGCSVFVNDSDEYEWVRDLLADGYAFQNSSGKWLTENDLKNRTAVNIIAAKAPITAIEYAVTGGSEFEYGSSATAELLATAQPFGSPVQYRRYKDNTLIDGAAGDTYTITDLAALPVGEHTYRVEATRDGYTKSAEKTITITKIDLAKAEINFPYGNSTVFWPNGGNNSIGNTRAPLYTVTLGGKTLTENEDYEVVQNHTTGVGPQTLEIRAKEGTNYTGTKTADWKVERLSLRMPALLNMEKGYDGTTTIPENSITNYFSSRVYTSYSIVDLKENTDYKIIDPHYATADAGDLKTIIFTIKLLNDNYIFEDGTTEKTFTVSERMVSTTRAIDPIDMPDFTKTTTFSGVVNDLAAEYDIDLPALPELAAPRTYGDIQYALGDVNLTNGYGNAEASIVTVDGTSKLRLKVPAVKHDKAAAIGTVTVNVTTTNYKPVTLTVNLNAVNKYPPTVTATAKPDTITYGTKLADVKLSAEAVYGDETVAGAIAWDEDTTALLNAGSHELKWKFTPADTDKYREATGKVTLTVKQAAPAGEPKYTAITSGGKTLADAGLTAEGGTFSVPGTVKWADAADTAVKANTAYTWKFTPKDTVNYTELTGSITLYRVSSSGGGSSAPIYKPSVAPSKDGTTTVSNPNPKKGDTVTITPKPADGNEVSKVIVTDKNGKTIEVKANADGTYRFVQPDSAVTIQVVYQPKPTAQTDFADVSAAHFAYDAVKWAAENGVTGGIGDNLFAPSQSCTRAQIVTFLWRAAGSPEPKSLSGLTDVPTDAYYAKAVAWAVENGITGGIGDGLFAPDAACTRAQSVTLLARALNAKANGKADFTDVPADSYYAEAVAWAVENGVTNGMGDDRFAPNRHCTRAQIVTFLYRAYNRK